MLLNVFLLSALSVYGPTAIDEKTTSDTVRLKEVVVSSKLKRYSSGLSLKIVSPTELRQNSSALLTDLLSNQASVNVNSYSPGGTSNVSLRGLSSAHTAVLWNGINLQSSMNAGVSFGSIPTFFVDQVVVQQGGNGALFGSGAIGGVIHLDNVLPFGTGSSGEVMQSVGSYGLTYTGAKYTYSGAKMAISSRLFYTEAENNYKITSSDNRDRQINARYRKGGIMETGTFALTGNDRMVVSLWGQDGYNQYPPMVSNTMSSEYDYNHFLRATAQWQATRHRVDFNIKSALFSDWENYRNPGIERSNHHTTQGLLEGEAIVKLSAESTLEGGINASYERATSTNYPEIKERYRPAGVLGYRFKADDIGLESFASIRQELVDGKASPMTWSVGIQKRLMKGLQLRGNASRNYRIPSFNDLYWKGWGNQDLKPEEGYGEELGLDYLHTKNGFLLSMKAAAFNNNVNNWIQWKPNGSVWSPINVGKAWSRGAEASITVKQQVDRMTLGVDVSGMFTRSTDQTKESPTKGMQLMYTPKYKGSAAIYVQAKSFSIRYTQSYTGRRYYIGNTDWLNPFWVASVAVDKTFDFNWGGLRPFARIDNIWNEEYQMQKGYALPLRTFQAGISVSFGR
ncbi:TonB-dependent receptor domain-containing protein [uncultured Acetobacteroides sp.]|uniref:TonB-dependent receptor plug domain-containing protein n=1 Tax=uncultured Acetobacteroides sp. TaxID=1760811 RepID=UPI0029F4975A|nr:TonB-dependent receptor [uncultured Acetobacteroides sp.]